jgi:hypothetical protein
MAETPWGELPVADAHMHFFSRRFYETLAAQKKLPRAEDLTALLEWDIPAEDPGQLATRWCEQLDLHGISRAALIASIPEDEESVEAAIAAYPERFFGYFMLDPLRPQAFERLKTVLGRGVLRGVCLFPAMHGYSIADPRLLPMFELAADRRAIVFVHCGVISVGVRERLGLASPVDMRYSNPLDLQPVAMHFPQIRFVVPHFGAGFFRETLMLCDLCPNVYLDTSSSNRWIAYEPSGLDLRDVFRRAIELIGSKRLLFGSDSSYFPRGWNAPILEQQTKALYELALDADDARRILHDNFIDLFVSEAPAKR